MSDLKEKRKQIYREARHEKFLERLSPELCEQLMGRFTVETRDTFLRVVDWVLEEAYKTQEEANTLANERFEAYRNDVQKDEVLTIESVMSHDPNGLGMHLYRRRQTWMRETTGDSVAFSGYFQETNQGAVRVAFRKYKPFEDQLHILQFAPFIKPITHDGKTFKSIGVFEHTLSRYGVYNIEIFSDTCWHLCNTAYSHKTIIKEFSGARECLRYVYDNHPYEGTNSEATDDDDDDD
jgi:hypothetical protein